MGVICMLRNWHGDIAPEKGVTFTSIKSPLALVLHLRPLARIREVDTGRWLGYSECVQVELKSFL